MLTTRDEIHMVKDSIKRKENELSMMDRNDPNNRFKYANAMSELRVLRSKLDELTTRLQEEYKNGTYIPVVGDDRYSNYPHKASLDDLRVKHFTLYKNDLSISYCGDGAMFGGESLSTYADFYKIKGMIPFKLIYSSIDSRLVQDKRASLGVKIDREAFDKASEKDIEFLTSFIESYTTNPVNFIMTDGLLKEVFFAHISNKEFSYTINHEKDYYSFLHDLCHNLIRNFVYLGESLEEDANKKNVKQAKKDFIESDKMKITKASEITQDILNKENEAIKRKILRIN